jgi:2-polyprenyl-3-methyl-5-hydroxy-6-metoxy-1,4-benzoquinol methylase
MAGTRDNVPMGFETAQDSERWDREAEFFDREEYSEGPIPENTIRRYLECANPYTPAEYPFAIFGDVRGKHVLELGCGDGGNAVILALKGATVVGIDVSRRAIAAARNKARLHGVAGSTEFFATPAESYLKESRSETFDIICGFGVLHHLIPVLDSVMSNLKRVAREDTLCMFTEPVMPRSLRKVRLKLPVPVHGTPDERPLDERDLAIIRRHFPGMQVHFQRLLTRFWWRLAGGRAEDYSGPRRFLYRLLCRVDRVLLCVPVLRGLAANVVIVSTPR